MIEDPTLPSPDKKGQFAVPENFVPTKEENDDSENGNGELNKGGDLTPDQKHTVLMSQTEEKPVTVAPSEPPVYPENLRRTRRKIEITPAPFKAEVLRLIQDEQDNLSTSTEGEATKRSMGLSKVSIDISRATTPEEVMSIINSADSSILRDTQKARMIKMVEDGAVTTEKYSVPEGITEAIHQAMSEQDTVREALLANKLKKAKSALIAEEIIRNAEQERTITIEGMNQLLSFLGLTQEPQTPNPSDLPNEYEKLSATQMFGKPEVSQEQKFAQHILLNPNGDSSPEVVPSSDNLNSLTPKFSYGPDGKITAFEVEGNKFEVGEIVDFESEGNKGRGVIKRIKFLSNEVEILETNEGIVSVHLAEFNNVHKTRELPNVQSEPQNPIVQQETPVNPPENVANNVSEPEGIRDSLEGQEKENSIEIGSKTFSVGDILNGPDGEIGTILEIDKKAGGIWVKGEGDDESGVFWNFDQILNTVGNDEKIEDVEADNPREVSIQEEPEEIGEDWEEGEKYPELKVARAEYVNELLDWKNKVREKRTKVGKILSDLGAPTFKLKPEQMPDKTALIVAEKKYIAEKKRIVQEILDAQKEIWGIQTNDDGSEIGFEEENRQVREEWANIQDRLMSRAEDEYKILQQKILESTTSREKGRIGKAFETWSKLPKAARIGMSTALMTGVGLAFGTIGVGAVASYGGFKFARSFAGAVAGEKVNEYLTKQIEEDEKTKEKNVFRKYSSVINEENFEDVEKYLTSRLEEIKDQRKLDNLKKALFVGTTVGVTNITLGGLASALTDHPQYSGSGSIKNSLDSNSKVSVSDQGLPKPNPENPIPGNTRGVNPALENSEANNFKPDVDSTPPEPVKVELSNRGFIKTIDDLKDELKEKYDGVEKPASVKHLIDTDSTKLAQELGFYDAKTGLSGFGLKGEHLFVDAKGNLRYEHLNGDTHTIIDAEHGGKITKFSEIGKMEKFGVKPNSGDIDVAKVNAPVGDELRGEIGTDPNSLNPQDVNQGTPSVQGGGEGVASSDINNEVNPEDSAESVFRSASESPAEPTNEIIDKDALGQKDFMSNGKIIETSQGKVWSVNNITFAHEHSLGRTNILMLDDKFQNGDAYKAIRTKFGEILDKNFKEHPIAAKIIPADFEANKGGGRIHILQDVDGERGSVKVLLNGKQIAMGKVDNGGSIDLKSLKMVDAPGLKSGIFFPDTVYERAFKSAKSIIKNLKNMK